MAIVTCSRCGARNRVEAKGAGVRPVCGRCGEDLPVPAAGPLEVTDATFAEAVLEAKGVVLLDCWAEWCPPCKMLAPTIDALALEAGGRYVVAKLDTQRNPRTAAMLGIQSIPTLLVFKNGTVMDRIAGAVPKQMILSRLAPHL
jgi:thioredoxin 2